ncbi:MAG: protein-disulfide reductase DsbD family protein [Acidocella sp.]|nr:protein-disulfide reductase DsbD family protein [Acidocella sp.]
MRLFAVWVWVMLGGALLPGLAFGAASPWFVTPRDQVRLISKSDMAVGGAVALALEYKIAPGWHIYWSNPGDAGLPPQISGNVSAGALAFPPPELLVQGPVTDYVLSGHVVLPFSATHVGSQVVINARWLVCADVCVPEQTRFVLHLTGGKSAQANLFTPPVIVPSPFAVSITPDGALRLRGLGPGQVSAARFFPAQAGMIKTDAPQRLGFDAAGMVLRLALAPHGLPPAGVLELTDPAGAMQALAVKPMVVTAPVHLPYVLLAFLGGLILNLMPCVFPVLAIKALAMARLGGARGHIRREALGYAGGVVASMLGLGLVMLGLRGLGVAAGWGFQFQSPWFVGLIALMFFAIGLSLLGVFAVQMPGVLRHVPAQGSFATGVLAVLTATPCTAPFMGGAMAAALGAPVFAALGIFLGLGLGLAAPVLVLAMAPGLAARLPRPGPWMIRLQRALGVPMLAACVWLGWVLYHQSGWPGVGWLAVGAAILAVAVSRPGWRVAALASLLVLPMLREAPGATLSLPGSAPYTAARLAALRAAGRPVFIDATAAWCVTCLVNEATTLATPPIQAAFKAHHVAVLVADWTDKNPQITALLAANGRSGVPLYLYYAPGAVVPVVLPQVLDDAVVAVALGR